MSRRMSKTTLAIALAAGAAFIAAYSGRGAQQPGAGAPPAPGALLPLEPGSLRFAVIGDMGTGGKRQYQVADQMVSLRARFPFEFVLTVGDNIYGRADFKKKFEIPYAALLSAGVKFYASLGNHDNPNQRFYEPFNMGGKRYYSFKKGDVTFFALDTTLMDPVQLAWIAKELQESRAAWKICYFHHPLYSNAKKHGSDLDLRAHLEPLFESAGVNVVFSGHDHVYERLKPQRGIQYFVMGSSGQLRSGNLRKSELTAKGFDTDRAFLIVEIAGDTLHFQAISRTGVTVDHGVVLRENAKVKSAVSGN
jgi:hypothetical protein